MSEQAFESSRALWNRSGLSLESDEVLAQILDRGEMTAWRALYRLARNDAALRARITRIVLTVPVPLPRFWLAALASLGSRSIWPHPYRTTTRAPLSDRDCESPNPVVSVARVGERLWRRQSPLSPGGRMAHNGMIDMVRVALLAVVLGLAAVSAQEAPAIAHAAEARVADGDVWRFAVFVAPLARRAGHAENPPVHVERTDRGSAAL